MIPMHTPLLSHKPKSTSTLLIALLGSSRKRSSQSSALRASAHRSPRLFAQALIAVLGSSRKRSSQHLHGHILVAGNVLHVHALQAVEVDLKSRHEVEQVLQGDRALHPGQRRAQAAVDSVAESEVLRFG